MSERKSSSNRRWFTAAAAFLLLAVAGCADYTKRRDTITLSAGEAQAWNRTVHVADPWPRSAGNTQIDGDGQRVARVYDVYRKGDVIAPTPSPIALSVENAADKTNPKSGTTE